MQECKQNLETLALRMKKMCTELLTACYGTVKQAQRGSSDTQDELDVVPTLRAGFWTGMQAAAGNSGNQDEDDVQRALTAGYWHGCKQEEERVTLRTKRMCTEP